MAMFSHQQSPLKGKLRRQEHTIGSWLTIPSVPVVEIMASAGFEWLVIDIEHAAIDINQVQHLITAIQGCGMEALVRVSSNEEVIIKRVLDAGANGIIVPMVKTAAEARTALDWVHYPPHGKRGVGLNRAQHYGTGFDSYQEWLRNECVVIFQIEHILAVDNLDDILRVDGLDAIIVGPYDLSASMGTPGQYQLPAVQEALLRIETVARRHQVPAGFHVIQSDYEKVLDKIRSGNSFLAFSLDFFFLGDKARQEMASLKTALHHGAA
jgi:2-dehydro-3-deoxyglucarate aldolase